MTTVEAHLVLMSTALVNLVGILIGIAHLRDLRRKLNGHLHDHMNNHDHSED